MNTRLCVCGTTIKRSNTQHARSCQAYKDHVETIKDLIRKEVPDFYTECFSVSETIKHVQQHTEFVLEGSLRNLIVSELKEQGLYRGLSDPELNAKRQERIQQTMMDRYGVVNNGQREDHGFSVQNKIPYAQLDVMVKAKEFRAAVDKDLKKKRARNQIEMLTHCEYTGIEFADISGPTNPNDPLKRTFDHRVPVIECFFKGWTVDQVNAPDNLIQCVKVINTIKGNTREDSFQELLPLVKEMINESIKIRTP